MIAAAVQTAAPNVQCRLRDTEPVFPITSRFIAKTEKAIRLSICEWKRIGASDLIVNEIINDIVSLVDERVRYVMYQHSLVDNDGERNRRFLVENYPLLCSILDEVIADACNYYQKLFLRISENVNIFPDGVPSLSRIICRQSDTHEAGKAVAMIANDSGQLFVYKPRPVTPEVFAHRLSALLKEQGADFEFFAPYMRDMGSYGIQDFVTEVRPQNPSTIERWYYNNGALLYLFHLLSSRYAQKLVMTPHQAAV